MDSINLFISPLTFLEAEAKRRKFILICLLGAWLMIMGVLVSTAYVMKYAKEKRVKELSQQLESLKPQMANYQRLQKKRQYQTYAQCTALRLGELFETPIKGLHLSKMTVNDHWEMEGSADFPQALDQYKKLIETHFESSEWVEQLARGELSFRMQGRVACS